MGSWWNISAERLAARAPAYRTAGRGRTRGMDLCGHDSGARLTRPEGVEVRPCPREKGHSGDCYYVAVFPHPSGTGYRCCVYVGVRPAADFRELCKGNFTEKPNQWDLLFLCQTIARARRADAARRQQALEHPVPLEPEAEDIVGSSRRRIDAKVQRIENEVVAPAESAAANAMRAAIQGAQHGAL